MHTPVSQDVPVYWRVHTCAMQEGAFISTKGILEASTSASCVCSAQAPTEPQLCCGPTSSSGHSYTTSTLMALAALRQARTCHLCMQTRLRRRPRRPSLHSLLTFWCVYYAGLLAGELCFRSCSDACRDIWESFGSGTKYIGEGLGCVCSHIGHRVVTGTTAICLLTVYYLKSLFETLHAAEPAPI